MQPISPIMSKRASIRDVAREAGVSHTTVSLILNGKVPGSPETRGKVLEAVERLNYQPDALYRKAVIERTRSHSDEPPKRVATKILAFILPRWMQEQAQENDGYYSQLVAGATNAAADLGYHILLCPQERDPMGIPAIIQEDRVDGVLLEGTFSRDWFNLLVRRYPCAYMDRYYPGLNAISVTTNWPSSAFAQVEYAWNHGHRNFVFLDTEAGGKPYLGTYRAFHEALECLGGSLVHPHLSLLRSGAFDAIALEHFVDEWLECSPRPTVILGSDFIGTQLTEIFQSRGIRVPEDVSIIGRLGHISAQFSSPPLTSYEYPVEEIARRATRLLVESIQTGRLTPVHMMIEGRLIERASVCSLKD